MKLLSNAHPPYKSGWKLKAEGADGADKWLAERLEEGYVLHSASGAVINRVFDVDAPILLVVRYDPEAALSLVDVCNELIS